MSSNGNPSDWASLPKSMSASVSQLQKLADNDPWWQGFINTGAIAEPVTFGIKSAENHEAILITVGPERLTKVSTGLTSQAVFTLSATGGQWAKFFEPDPQPQYSSFMGLHADKQEGASIQGDHIKFAQYAHFALRSLELLRDGLHGPLKEDAQDESDEDYITGRYIYINPPLWGRCKTHVETAGTGPQQILFCHTAGSDSRQYHGVMNDKRMREKCTMYAFDLPAHGMSFPYKNYVPGGHTNTEDSYVGAIKEVIRMLKLNKPLVCGASMAGQVCIAVAIRAEETGAGGTIPLQGCDYLTMDRGFSDKSPVVNQTLFNPNWVYGLMAPKSPATNKLLIWHSYSSSAYGIFHGDLDFYCGGFDARERVHQIDVTKCPIYFLTGEFDWSTTPKVSEATAAKINGAKMVPMKGLGHFPATESPAKFVPYLMDAIDWIQKTRKD